MQHLVLRQRQSRYDLPPALLAGGPADQIDAACVRDGSQPGSDGSIDVPRMARQPHQRILRGIFHIVGIAQIAPAKPTPPAAGSVRSDAQAPTASGRDGIFRAVHPSLV